MAIETEGLFCRKPFEWFEVGGAPYARGAVHLCCPDWLPVTIGNLSEAPLDEIWNSTQARVVRRTILDGSFRLCSRKCPHLQNRTGPVQPLSDVRESRLLSLIERRETRLPFGPIAINCAFDRSCNLSCPSCRREHLIESDAERAILQLQESLSQGALRDAELLYITGSGDAFGSPYFNRWLRRMRASDFPSLRCIHLHTNGLLWTPTMWKQIDPSIRTLIRSAELSIDAAHPETYARVRRGGDFGVLLKNLEFIRSLRETGPLEYLKFHMVVQRDNYREMPDFVGLGERYGADTVYFSKLADWKTHHPRVQRGLSICDRGHPEFGDLEAVLGDPVFDDPIVDLGNLREFRMAMAERPAFPRGPVTEWARGILG